ncbi:hypothetical protein L1049_004684 [Liquidambar formosana]|uniref:DEUBAD domain-containing protein n=1 Tax=Liquidambar formosana TaxID=63359 RepID=A0AAP0RPE6_LIQFO
MGPLKIGHRISSSRSHCRQSSYSSNVEGLEMEGNHVSEPDSGGDSDDCELTEVRCELGVVEGQLCNIPYELYDLQDLKDILSLDTWNLCLTDEERFSLSAYLPDMDQQTFWLTMKELLGGSNLFFGNPTDIFFKRLKSGLYPPKVTCFREGLQLLQRRMHYHLLRSYHENMGKTFINMRRVWDQCTTKAGIEERVYIWTRRKNHGEYDLLDLGGFPKDGYLSSKEVNADASMCHFSKRMKSLESKRTNKILPSLPANGMKYVTSNSSGKGILKIKASGSSSFQNHNLRSTLERCRPAPKGVLKTVSKVPSTQLEQPRMVTKRLQPTLLVDTQGLPDSRFSSLPETVYKCDAGGFGESPFRWQEIVGGGVHGTLEQPQCILSQHKTGILGCNTRPGKYSEIFIRKTKREKILSLDAITDLQGHKLFGSDSGKRKGDERGPNKEYESSMDFTDARKHACGSEIFWQNLGAENREFSLRSFEQYPFGIQCYDGEPHTNPVREEHITSSPRISEIVSRIPNIGIGEHEKFMESSERMKGQTDVSFGGLENLHSIPGVSEGLQDELVCPLTYKRRKVIPGVSEGLQDELVRPLTYKRRKASEKRSSSDFGKPLTVGADLKSATPKELNHHVGKSAKAVKTKLKGWKDQSLNNE